ncbi:MAG: hypothetical protein A3J24_10060 [Deltaproteobacteria bacterium RIFCSPLOWO2_02_FULL_53_8]|nr:MAG: hypothetical protein A3J24_10060 [Deltaproteobacteria bacterium RIFCSPLOWO2_02_FULL_53_8]
MDNSVAARQDNVLLKVEIKIYVDGKNNPTKFIIRDNAKGISPENFGVAICPAGIVGGTSLNEHGLGMKQAIAAMGDLSYLATKTKNEHQARVVLEFKYGNLPFYRHDVEFECGTEICVKNIKPIVTTSSTSITRTLVPHLGARYRRFLKPDKKKLDLSIALIKESTGEVEYSWNVEEIKITYFHPSTRRNEPIIHRYSISGEGWKAELTFGYAPQDAKDYEELGIDIPNKFHPYNVSLSRQGLDLIRHDRVIRFHQLSEIEIITARHPDYNHIRGEIDLLDGFSTAITKNSIIDDNHFRECINVIRDILNGETEGPDSKKKNYLKVKTYPEQIPEKLLRDRLAAWLGNNPINKRAHVDTEYVLEGIEGYIDILADEEVWEIKTDQAAALDVYQLFMYIDIKGASKGFLVANSFSTGANIAVRHIKEKYNVDITFATLGQFPITHPPTDAEREEYY